MESLEGPEVGASLKLPMRQACACPTTGVIDLLGKKWTLCVLATVANESRIRFNQLQERLADISPKTLSDTLKALEKHGVVARQAFAEVPPRVEYTLTPSGRSLVEAAAPLLNWAAAHGDSVCVAC
jgi:DNA-binding HxlR family transcriptional regulator